MCRLPHCITNTNGPEMFGVCGRPLVRNLSVYKYIHIARQIYIPCCVLIVVVILNAEMYGYVHDKIGGGGGLGA
jgi:hypothetical protein